MAVRIGQRSAGRQAAMFVPQLPYLPLGDLRAVTSYPNEEDTVDDRLNDVGD